MSVYAAWNPISEDRRGSASGGIATMLARQVLSEGGVYFGVRWSGEMKAVLDWTEDDVEPFRNSKYIQAQFSSQARSALETFLEAGRKVLFVGTPCQVASLRALRHYPNLICVDLLCHGTVPPEYLEEEIAFLCKETPDRITFRNGPLFRFSLWKGSSLLYSRDAKHSPFLWAYLSGLSLKEACFRCPFANLERSGDITLGDFIGIERHNASFVWIHSKAGEELFQRSGAAWEERKLEERLSYRPGILECTKMPKERTVFEKALKGGKPFPKAVRKALRPYFMALPFKSLWNWCHHQAHLMKVKCQK